MTLTFDPVLPKTVPPTYSWDEGVPSFTGANLIDLEVDSEGYYVGYAPFTFIRLSSVPIFDNKDSSIYTLHRTIRFNDHYTCSSPLTSLGFDEEFFCHTYIMPGIYEIELKYTKYAKTNEVNMHPKIFFQQEPTEVDLSPVINLAPENERGNILWKWKYLLCNPPIICDTGKISEDNVPIAWKQTICDTSNEVIYSKTWKEAHCTCSETPPVLIPFATTRTVLWNWNRLSCSVVDEENMALSWTQASCKSEYCRTWEETKGTPCLEDVLPHFDVLANNEISIKLSNKIKVLEISPVAYLSAMQPDTLNRTSPLSATLTSRFTKLGSFPIEKIVWDLGDGSPLLTQRRWSIDSSYPFVYTGVFSNDPSDPRNYDVQHIYTVTRTSGFTFYPSMTAFAYSTGTTDCASTIIGPIRPEQYDHASKSVSLLQNNINDQKIFTMLYQIQDNIVAAKFEN